MSPEDQELVSRFKQAREGGREIDYESLEFKAYRRYMFAVADREAAVVEHVKAERLAAWGARTVATLRARHYSANE